MSKAAGKGTTVGLVGCGHWGRHILRDLLTLDCDVVVVAPSESTRDRATKGGAIRTVGHHDELPRVQGIVIATPATTHFEVARQLADRGVPIFVEKPFCTSVSDARTLADSYSDRIFVMDKWRYHPGVEMLREIARSGELGPVVALRTLRAQWGNRHLDTDTVRHLAPHDLAIVLEILGEIPRPRMAVAERDGERYATLLALLGTDPWVQIEVTSRYPRICREIRLQCRDGVALLSDAYDDHVRILRPGKEISQPTEETRKLSSELPLYRELRAFIDHLRGGLPPRSSAREGVAIIEVIEILREMADPPRF